MTRHRPSQQTELFSVSKSKNPEKDQANILVSSNDSLPMVNLLYFASQSQSRLVLHVTGSGGGGRLSLLVELQEGRFLCHHGNGAFVATWVFHRCQGLFLWRFGGVRLPKKTEWQAVWIVGKLSYLVPGLKFNGWKTASNIWLLGRFRTLSHSSSFNFPFLPPAVWGQVYSQGYVEDKFLVYCQQEWDIGHFSING